MKKLVHITTFYSNYLNDFYSRYPQAKDASFEEHYQLLMSDCFAWADFWKKNLEKIGDYEVVEIVANEENLQKKWAKKHNVSFNKENWLIDIVDEQIRFYQPDILFVDDLVKFSPNYIESLKSNYSNIKLIIGWDGVSLNDVKRFSVCDIILSCNPHIVEYYKLNGLISYLLTFGFETTILDRIISNETARYSVTFAGSVIGKAHERRYDFLAYISKKMKIDIFSNLEIGSPCSMNQILTFLKGNFEKYLNDFHLYGKIHKPVYGLNMYKLLSNSDITLNFHHNLTGDYAGNMRLFEATGVGACLVTEWKKNIRDFFEPDKEVVTYKTFDEAADKIKNLQKDEKLRKSIASEGQKRTLTQHSFYKKAQELDTIISRYL